MIFLGFFLLCMCTLQKLEGMSGKTGVSLAIILLGRVAVKARIYETWINASYAKITHNKIRVLP